MIVQWCCKGVKDLPAVAVRQILTDGAGLTCRLWQLHDPLPLGFALSRLTEYHLDLHVNDYFGTDPGVGPVQAFTPFLSLAAGCVERDVLLRTNVLHPARRTALAFATDYCDHPGWVFTCYVIVSTNNAVAIPAVAEEVRDLNRGRRYSSYFTEGEVAAKINVPSTQILCAERWEPDGGGLRRRGVYLNHGFTYPKGLLNERRAL